jgi:hypothetical protein
MNTRNNLICPHCEKKITPYHIDDYNERMTVLKYSWWKNQIFKMYNKSKKKWYVSRRVISFRYNLRIDTIRRYDKLGIPNMSLGYTKIYNIEECDKWMKENKMQYFRIKDKTNLDLISEY